MRKLARRDGISLIEVLVVLAVVGLLIAILLPAIQKTREAARRTQCKNNMKQIGLAISNYHDVHQVYPLNYGAGAYDGTNRGASWMQMVLPYIEHHDVYSSIRFGQPLNDSQNRGVAQAVITEFRCPSDGSPNLMDGRANVAGPLAVNSYKASSGSNWNWGKFSPVVSTFGRNANNPDGLEQCNGLICRGGGLRPTVTRLVDITDGTSSTFATGEAVARWSTHTWWYWFNGVTAPCAIPLNHKRLPESSIADWVEHNGFKSEHGNGANFGFVDGSVRFLSEEVDMSVYRALATVQGEEITGDF